MRIMVVEDSHVVMVALCRLLEAMGHEPLEAATAAAALDVLARESVDVIITDLGLPDRTGLELASDIRDRHPHLPIVLTTGAADESLNHNAVVAGVRTVLTKPFDGESLRTTLEQL